MKIFSKKTNAGYTLIETMIAISLFLVVVTIGTSSLLNANYISYKSQNLRSIMDNLNFIMEDMSRNIRVGYNYHCGDVADVETPKSCAPGSPAYLFFEEGSAGVPGDANDQWGYAIFSNDGGATYNIYKTTNGATGATPWIQLNPDEIKIDSFSGFSVLGAKAPDSPPFPSPPSDTQQPLVTIKISGKITFRGQDTPFSLQTSVSQRLIDVAQ